MNQSIRFQAFVGAELYYSRSKLHKLRSEPSKNSHAGYYKENYMSNKKSSLETTGFVLVSLMILVQAFYGVFSFIAPSEFAEVRGTELFSVNDLDWVQIYGSRTLFITLVLSYLLLTRNFLTLMWCALFGLIMPIVDGYLGHQAQASLSVVLKHVATGVYLLVTFIVLKMIVYKK